VGIGPNDTVYEFSSGTICLRLDGPLRVSFGEGIYSSFYKLECNGRVGYVNVRWVRE
jgi:hypothetical protein